jgi:hypothetical protein
MFRQCILHRSLSPPRLAQPLTKTDHTGFGPVFPWRLGIRSLLAILQDAINAALSSSKMLTCWPQCVFIFAMAQTGQRKERKQAFELGGEAVAQFGKLLYRRLAVGQRIADRNQWPFSLCTLHFQRGGLMAKKPFKTSKTNQPFGCDRELSDWGKIENRPKKPAKTSRNQQKPAKTSIRGSLGCSPRLHHSATPDLRSSFLLHFALCTS